MALMAAAPISLPQQTLDDAMLHPETVGPQAPGGKRQESSRSRPGAHLFRAARRGADSTRRAIGLPCTTPAGYGLSPRPVPEGWSLLCNTTAQDRRAVGGRRVRRGGFA